MFSVNQLRLGTITATDYCLGSIPVQKMYLGSVLVFDRTPAEQVKYFFEVSPSEDMEFDALDSEKTLTVTSYSQVYSGDSPSGPVTPSTPLIQNPEFITNDIVSNEDGTFTITLKANDYYQDEDDSLSERNNTITISQSWSGDSATINISQSPIVPTVQNRWLRLKYAAEEDQYITVNKSNVELPYVSDWKNYVFPKKSTGIKPICWNAKITNQDFMHEVLAYMSEQTIVYVNEVEGAQENKSAYTAADSMCIATSNGDGLYFQGLLKGSGIQNGEITFKIDGNGYCGQFYECFSGCHFNKVTIQFMQDNIRISSMYRAFKSATINELNILDANGEPSTAKHFAARDLSGMCEWTYGITNFPDIIDWGIVDQNFTTDFGWAFSYAIPLISITQHGSNRDAASNTVKCNTLIQSFQKCSNLQSIGPVLDLSRVPGQSSDNGRAFEGCTALTDVRIRNLNGPTWHFDDDTQSGNIPNLDQASVTYLFDNLMDLTTYNAEDTSGAKPKSDHGDLYCPAEWQDKITSEMVIAAAAKNWNVYIGSELQTVTTKQYTLSINPTEATLTGVEGNDETTFTVTTYYQNVINGVVQDAKIHQTVQFDSHGANEENVILKSNNNNDNTYTCTLTCSQTTNNNDYVITITQDDSNKTVEFTLHKVDATITYGDITITSFTYPDSVSAAGGTVTPTVTYSQTYGYNGATTGGGTITSGATVTYSGTFVDASTGKITVPSKDTTVSGETTVSEVTVHVSMNGKTSSETFTVKQEANTATYGEVTGGTATANDILASGGTVRATVTKDATQTISYTSGSTRSGNITTSATEVSASSLGTTAKGKTQVGTSVLTFTGEGGKTQKVNVAVYQQANEITGTTYKDAQILLEADPMIIPATGGTSELTTYATRTRVDTYTSKATKETSESSAPYTTITGEGFSLSASSAMNITITVEKNTGAQRTATITSKAYDVTETLVITQESGQTISSYSDLQIVNAKSSGDIPASGGSSSATYQKVTAIAHYSSGITNTVEISPSDVTWNVDKVTASDLGTTEKVRTKIGTSTITAKWNGLTDSKTVDIYQEANVKTDAGITYGTWDPEVNASNTNMPASGGTLSWTFEAVRTRVQKYTYTSGATETQNLSNETTTTWERIELHNYVGDTQQGNHFTIDTNARTVTAPVNTTNSVYSCTVVCYMDEEWSSVKFTQQSGQTIASYGAITIANGSVTDIPASGGKVKASGCTATIQVTYSSGSTGSVTVPVQNITYTEVSAESLGTTVKSRTKVGTSACNVSYQGKSATKQFDVYQQANSKTADDIKYGEWQVSVSANPNTIDSNGGVRTITRTASRTRTQNYSYTSGATSSEALSNETGTPTLTSNQSWATVDGNNVTISKNTTTSSRTVTITGTYQSKSDTCTITQSGMQIESYGDITINGGSVSGDIPASGGSKSASGCTATIRVNYDNDTYENVNVPSSNISYSSVSGSNLGTTAKARTKVGTSRCTVSYQGKTATKDFDVYQQANSSTATDIDYGTWQVNVSANPTSVAASGGTSTITRSASRTRKQNHTWTSGATSQSDLSNETATPTLSVSGTGFSLNGTIVTATSNVPARTYTLQVSNPTGDLEEGPDQELTTSVTSTYTQPSSNSRSCTVTATYGGVSKQVTISQSGQSQSSGNQDWTVAKGTNMQTVTKNGNTLTMVPNAEYGNKDETYTATCTVTQTTSNKTQIVQGKWYKGYLNVTPATLDFTADGGTKQITIDTNLNWQVIP